VELYQKQLEMLDSYAVKIAPRETILVTCPQSPSAVRTPLFMYNVICADDLGDLSNYVKGITDSGPQLVIQNLSDSARDVTVYWF